MGRRPAKKLGAVPPAAKKQLYQRNVQIADINRQPSTVQKRGEPVTQISRKPAKKTEKPEFDVSDCGGSFWDNFLATLHRTVQQKKRDWVSTLLELLIPIIFIVGTIVIWAAFGTANNPAGSKFVTSPITNGIPAYTTAYYDQMVCNNASNNRKYTLRSCETATYTADCSGDESSLPDGVRGICVDDVYNATQVVGMYVNSAAGNPAIVPPLDSILVYQWLARKAQASLGVDVAALSLSSSGIVSKTRYDSIMCSGKIFFTPDNAVTKGLINYINSTSENFQYVNGGAVGSIEEATELAKNTDTMAIIEVKAFDKSNFNVDIHMNASALPNSASVVDPSYPGGYQYDRGEMYVVSGFSTLQKLVYEYYFESQQGLTSAQSVFEIYLVSTPWVAYISKQLLEYAAILISFIIVLAFLYPVSQLAKKIVLEKELRIREAMLIMGLSNTALYLVWFVVYALQNFFLCIVLTILLKVTYITKSNPFLLFMTLFVFALTTIPLAGLIASFFSKARLASLLAPLIFFVISVPTFAFTSASSDVILGVSIFSPTAFASAMNAILTRESAEGFHDSDFHYNRLEPIPYYLWIFMACDFVVYYLLMLYFDAVLPKDWGTRKHPLFFIIEPFKKCQNGDKGYAPNYGEDGRAEDGVFEEYDEEGLAVNIVGLRKEYKRSGKKFCALNNFYWGLKPNEISILLGHNGAGKSTCLNLITGMTTPDEGDCFIFGYSIIEQMGDIRKRIGYCPQHNILWPELTCREHLEYFGRIKGLRGGELEDAVTIVMDEVDLIEKMDQQSKSLSGGQMRKLSVAIAFVGRSPLVFLDEPTAGMDVGARRHTWELLRRMSDNHTIMLTTHYMDEADLLGDQIGILSRGRLQCSGSSVFLKSRLGAGYSMTVSLEPGASAEDVDRLVLSYVPGAEAANFNGVEIMYKLPSERVALVSETAQRPRGDRRGGRRAGVLPVGHHAGGNFPSNCHERPQGGRDGEGGV
ncbi:ABC-2 family transporter protein/ABC transporter, putative [Angomonas deanei]|uniref:ABC-2 family transporter protein/ABC transporter, putative n=1 Tax=Angomonas deanei TaxID=59799 RepID=A0A7G2CSJ2_9TRYP|nr:ABC-2 family transporter protein/ABC transporter, putative [Angomonas deanei]